VRRISAAQSMIAARCDTIIPARIGPMLTGWRQLDIILY